jgi:chemotaxis protein methyltransferase CheR
LEIWSAGCSTGEEVWSLACLFEEMLPDASTRIWGTDISNKALRIAEEAVYPVERCADLPASWLARYFQLEVAPQRQYRVSAALRARAVFRRLNLIEPLCWPQRFSLIFCRNVMIYFDRPTQETLVQRLEQALEPGGYLVIGQAESLTRIAHSLEYVQPAIFRRSRARGGRWQPSRC